MKVLPKASFESNEEAKITNPKTQSHCHLVKVMFLGFISPPNHHEDSDGKIMVKRVSKMTKTKGVSISKSFAPDFLTNTNIKEGEWHRFFPNISNMSIGESMEFICNHYSIPEKTAKYMFFVTPHMIL